MRRLGHKEVEVTQLVNGGTRVKAQIMELQPAPLFHCPIYKLGALNLGLTSMVIAHTFVWVT